MKNSTAIQTPLHLVGREAQPWDDATDHAERSLHLLRPYDPRWVFAVRAAEDISRTGHTAILDQSRERLVRHAQAMGLSRFEALGVIAIVAGELAAGRHPLGADTEYRLANMSAPAAACPTKTCGVPVALAVAITALVMAVFTYAALTL